MLRYTMAHIATSIGARLAACVATALLALAFDCLLAQASASGSSTRHVLVLHSYHKGYRWTDNIMAGIDRIFTQKAPEVELHVEYLDTKRYDNDVVFPDLRRVLALKYAQLGIEAIIASDDNALQFLLAYKESLFPNAAVVFCGINNPGEYDFRNAREYTGVVENFDLKSTIELIFRLQPHIKTIASISDNSLSSQVNLEQLRRIAPQFKDRASFVEYNNVSTRELVQSLRALSGDAAILHLNFFKDRDGISYNFRDSIRLVANNTSQPLYATWDWYLGYGVVGGLMTSGELQGETAAEMAIRILIGVFPWDIPVRWESPNQYMFDYVELVRQGITLSDLPQGSVVINRPQGLYERYGKYILAACAVILALTAATLALAWAHSRRKQAEKELEAIFANSLVGIVYLKTERRIVKVNQRITDILGYLPYDLHTKPASVLHLSDKAAVRFGELYYEKLRRKEIIHVEFRLRRRNGAPVWCLISGKALAPPDLDRGVIWVIDDISERKRTEKELLTSRRELAQRVEERTEELKNSNDQLLREIHKHKRTLELLEDQQKQYYRNLLAIFDSLPDAIVTVDLELRIIEVNEAFVGLCCKPRLRLLRLHLSDANMPCSDDAVHIVSHTLSTCKAVSERRAHGLNSDGLSQTMIMSTAPFLDPTGAFAGAVLEVRDITRLMELEHRLDEQTRFGDLIGASDAMRQVFRSIEKYRDFDSTVLILGESGTGKELVAESLHYGGPTKDGAFVKVNCSALSENLLESELFGHVRGAFTGAVRDKVGRFEAAEGGTVFLDEIGDISPAIQVKLLRFLGQKEFERVGETRIRKANVRVLAATNVDMAEKVKLGLFREDLYYRLKVMVTNLPPLRERGEDILLLAHYFLSDYAKRFKKNLKGFSLEALGVFTQHRWPGNVRELKHVVEHACIVCPEGEVGVEHLPPDIASFLADSVRPSVESKSRSTVGREEVLAALSRTHWNKSETARILGMSRTHLYRIIQKYGLS